MADFKIGKVIHYYDKIKVAIIELNSDLSVGEKIRFERGGEELFEQNVDSIQVEHENLETAKSGETVSIFMASKHLPELVDFFKASYEKDVPVDLVYRAGYSGSEKVVQTNLENLKSTWEAEKEKSLFLLFVGPCLNESAKAHRH